MLNRLEDCFVKFCASRVTRRWSAQRIDSGAYRSRTTGGSLAFRANRARKREGASKKRDASIARQSLTLSERQPRPIHTALKTREPSSGANLNSAFPSLI